VSGFRLPVLKIISLCNSRLLLFVFLPLTWFYCRRAENNAEITYDKVSILSTS
jgi:DUF1365 family protein